MVNTSVLYGMFDCMFLVSDNFYNHRHTGKVVFVTLFIIIDIQVKLCLSHFSYQLGEGHI